MMLIPSPFQYKSAREFVLARFAYEKENPKEGSSFSIRKWTKEHSFGSHTLLVMVLQGKRNLTLKQVPALSRGFNLSSSETLYLQTTIQFDNAKSDEEKKLCELWMLDLNPAMTQRKIEADQFQVIADWYHSAIMALTRLKNFTTSPEWIVKKLNHLITIEQATAAIERMVRLEILVLVNDQWRCQYSSVSTPNEVTSLGAQEYHRQTAKLSESIATQQALEERELQSFCIPIHTKNIPQAKALIKKFRSQFCALMQADAGDEVYQLNLHFFRLTERPEVKSLQADDDLGTGFGMLGNKHILTIINTGEIDQ